MRREYDDATARQFLVVLRTVSSLKILNHPAYDIGKISGLRKPSPKIGPDTGKAIDSLSEIGRTNWLMPQLPEAHFETIRLVEHEKCVIYLTGEGLSNNAHRPTHPTNQRKGPSYSQFPNPADCFSTCLLLGLSSTPSQWLV